MRGSKSSIFENEVYLIIYLKGDLKVGQNYFITPLLLRLLTLLPLLILVRPEKLFRFSDVITTLKGLWIAMLIHKFKIGN